MTAATPSSSPLLGEKEYYYLAAQGVLRTISCSVESLFITVAVASSVLNFVLDSSISAIKFHITNIQLRFVQWDLKFGSKFQMIATCNLNK